MIIGEVWEYICPRCGWFPSIPCSNLTKEAKEKVKQLLDRRIKEHNEKCRERNHE